MKTELSTDYRENQPTLEEFGLEKVDFQKIEKSYEEYQKHRKSIGYYFWNGIYIIGLFAVVFGGMALGIIAILWLFSLSAGSLKQSSDEFQILGKYIIFVVGALLIQYFAEKVKDSIYNRPFVYQTEYDNIKKYTAAVREYVVWQERKKREYWYALSGREFELNIAKIFQEHGWNVKICKQGGDGGIDIEATMGRKRLAIQCKAHKSKISPAVARDLLGTAVAGHYDAACLVTLEGGTAGTVDFCKKNHIILWDISNILHFQEK